jgi:tetratricopeptide (TPR) repeat protein
VLYFARDYDQAVAQCRKALDLDPNSSGAYDCMGTSYLAKGMYEEALAASQKAVSLSNSDPARLVGLGRAYALADRKSEALRVLEQLQQKSRRGYLPPYFLATIYAALGEKDKAFASLDSAVAERDIFLAWVNVDSAADPLRSDPRFQELLRRIGLSA